MKVAALNKSLSWVSYSLFTAILSVGYASQGQSLGGAGFYNKNGLAISGGLAEIVAEIPKGSIILLGEEHNQAAQADLQMQILEALTKAGHQVAVGMEFVSYPHQTQLNQYQLGEISESDFLASIGWGDGFSFDHYRRQIMFSSSIWALNAPRSLTSRVARGGLDSLTDEEKALLPPNFAIGNSHYFERFVKAIGHLPNPEAGARYFAAQSIWDDTMAWRTALALQKEANQTFVIIVGEFHVQYGGGLPDRILKRGEVGERKVITFSLLNGKGLTPEEVHQAISPSEAYGPRADFIWLGDY